MLELDYLTDGKGRTKAVIIPIAIWNNLFPQADLSLEEISERIEDYCLGKAMEEAKNSPLLNREEALKFFED